MKASLSELEAVSAIARHGGFRSAARVLGVSSSALSHAVAMLEARLGVRLFHRTTRSVSLTQAGAQFVAELDPALRAIDEALDQVTSGAAEPQGTLRINMFHGAARLMLDGVLLDFARRYPRVMLEIVTENAFVDITRAGFDAGVRFADAVPPDMIAVPITSQTRFIVVATPQYLAGHGRPATPHDLGRHRCIRMRLPGGRIYRWEFERNGAPLAIDAPGNLVLDEVDLVVAAALGSAGLAYLDEREAAPHIARGALVEVLGEWTPPFCGLSLYYAGHRQIPAKLRALIDHVRAFTARD